MSMVKTNEPMPIKRTKRKKASGTSFEYRVKVFLERHGWIIFRSAGSHTCADLIGYKKYDNGSTRNIWIQCKAGVKLVLSAKEKAELIEGYTKFGITPVGICRSKTFGHKLQFYMYHIGLDKFVVVPGVPEWI